MKTVMAYCRMLSSKKPSKQVRLLLHDKCTLSRHSVPLGGLLLDEKELQEAVDSTDKKNTGAVGNIL